MRFLLTCALLLAPLGAAAQAPRAPASQADCEKLRDDLAYNQCLASFGPRRGERSARGTGVPDDNDETLAATPGARTVRRARNGRWGFQWLFSP